jgi:hypothetical protein
MVIGFVVFPFFKIGLLSLMLDYLHGSPLAVLVFGFEQVQAHGQRPQVKTVSRLALYWLQHGTQHATPLYIYDPKVHLATPYPIGTYRQPVRHGVGCYAELKTQFSLFLCR